MRASGAMDVAFDATQGSDIDRGLARFCLLRLTRGR
jgi:hypothetical protein